MSETDPLEGVPAPLRAAMEARGMTQLTPVQQAVLSGESAGRNLRISSQTGSGKTLALGLRLADEFIDESGVPRPPDPSHIGPRVLIIAPTRELAAQVAGELSWLLAGLRAVTVESVTGGSDIIRERRALSRKPAILVGTPGRLLDHIRSRGFRCDSIKHVVLDEADQMLDMGFREELEAILEALPAERSAHLVSATFPPVVRKLADRFQKNALHVEGTRLGEANADIAHVAHRIRPGDLKAALINVLLSEHGNRCLVFVRRRIDSTEIADRLASDGFSALPMSGELTQAQRTRTLDAFRSGATRILIATDVAARGIDIADIGVVIHADLPTDSETYTHRSGRTGRAGQKGRSILLVPAPAERRVRRLLETARVPLEWQETPSAEKISRAFTKSMRRDLHAKLDAPEGVSEAQKTYAEHLLKERDPTLVIAALLEMAQSSGPRAPAELGKIQAGKPQRDKRERGVYDTFEINWGKGDGATSQRVLSHVCRRGGISGRDVGVIRIDQRRTIVEIAREVSSSFESKVRAPDARDPGLSIRRSKDRAASIGGGRPRRPTNVSHERTPGADKRPRPHRPERSHAQRDGKKKKPARR